MYRFISSELAKSGLAFGPVRCWCEAQDRHCAATAVSEAGTAVAAALALATEEVLWPAGTSGPQAGCWDRPRVSEVWFGTAVNGASDALGSAVGNLFNKQKNQPKAPRPPAASVAGVHIYVPVNSAVMFTLTSAPMQSAQGQPGATSVAQPVQQTPAATGMNTAPGSNTVTYLQVQYVLQGCTRQAPHIICNLTITNQRGGDIVMNGGGGAYYIDQAGNRVNAMMRSLANCVGFGPCQLVPGVAMASQWQFVDQDNLAKTLVRLEIHENGVAVAQFNNIPVN